MRISILIGTGLAMALACAGCSDRDSVEPLATSAIGEVYPVGTVVPVVADKGARMHPDPAAPDYGRRVFQKWCAPCHAASPAAAGTVALAERYKATNIPAALEKRSDLSPDMVEAFVRNGLYTMPTFRKTEITDADLDALAAYLSKSK